MDETDGQHATRGFANQAHALDFKRGCLHAQDHKWYGHQQDCVNSTNSVPAEIFKPCRNRHMPTEDRLTCAPNSIEYKGFRLISERRQTQLKAIAIWVETRRQNEFR